MDNSSLFVGQSGSLYSTNMFGIFEQQLPIDSIIKLGQALFFHNSDRNEIII